ncbi:Bug1p PWA37_000652 [Arxiozyma heterogenica]|uniref:Uncharacterized protein n=1 Tax=Arxiozyma heterogenica TaxID=278026 RepID=A0AAN7W0C0_9SACH|nr:hypothetical protein RI543_004401 [Kazachstania heterogenica]
MSENNEVDEKRAKQLEEARKRVQELKKKKKSKNKKNKNKNNKDTETETDNKKYEEEIQNENDPVANTANNNTELNNGINKEENTKEEEEATATTTTKEDGIEEISNDSEVNIVGNESKEIESNEETRLELHNKAFEQSEESNKVDELFGDVSNDNNESDNFLTTIEKEKQEIEIVKLKEQIEKLLEEKKQLKFTNMEQETSIEELQEEVSELKMKLKESEDQINVMTVKLNDTENKLKEIESSRELFNDYNYNHTNTSNTGLKFASFQSSSGGNTPVQSTYSNTTVSPQNVSEHINNKSPQVVVDRVLLDKWKNWNIDMTTWRSIGSGPVVEL